LTPHSGCSRPEVPEAPCMAASARIRGRNGGKCAPLRPAPRTQNKTAPCGGGRNSRSRVVWTRSSNTRPVLVALVQERPPAPGSRHPVLGPVWSGCPDDTPSPPYRPGQGPARFGCFGYAPAWSAPGPTHPASSGTLSPSLPRRSTEGGRPPELSPTRPPTSPDRTPEQNSTWACGGAKTGVRASSGHGSPYGI